MLDLLFDIPWWLFGSLILVGCVVGWTGLQKQQKNSIYLGAAICLLAIGLKALSFVVETDKEKCVRQTTALVTSVEKRDWVKFASLLDEDATLGTSDATLFNNRQTLVEGTKRDTESFNPVNIGSSISKVEQDPTGVTVNLDVSAEGNGTMGNRLPTSWKMIWQRSGKEWRLRQIICTKIFNGNAGDMARWIGSGR